MFNPVLEKGTEGESRASEDVPIEAVCRNLKMEDSLASNVPQPWSDSVPDRKNGVSDGISGDSQHIEEVIVEPNLMNWSPEESCDDDYSNSEFKTEGGSETIPTTILGSESASRLFLALTSSSAPKSLSVANSLDKEPPACASSEYLKNMSNSSEIKEVSLDSIDKDEDYIATSMSVGCELSSDKLQRKCPYCNDEFDCSSRMESHIVYRHPGMKQHVCFQCLRVFRRQIDLIEHFRVHKRESCHQCPVCNRFFSATGTMKRHMKHFHPEQELFTCSFCRRVFCSQSDLDEHKECHQKEIVFNCPVCNDQFDKQESMIQHFEIHSTTQKIFCCVRCNLEFPDNDSLLGHMYTHSTEGLHICEICQKGFTKPASLKLHKLIHTGERPHQCPLCGKGFRQRAHLAGHMLIHSGERPHSCSQCGKTFQVRSKLKKHLVTHASQSRDNYKSSKGSLHSSTPLNYNAHSKGTKADGSGKKPNSNAQPNEETMNRAHDELNTMSAMVRIGEKQEDAEISEDLFHYQSQQTDWKPDELLPDECVSTNFEPEHIEVKVEPRSLSDIDEEMEEESITEDLIDTKEV
ncbi:zinc finger protein 492-like [Anabrus simplex]|uniref:zinc finger protein 492-like n=1 Tax=Anabrus simplex TaxID=316456 RepID=UPI0035A3AD08